MIEQEKPKPLSPKRRKKHKGKKIPGRLSPAKIIPVSFLVAILLGTVLLSCPFASATGESCGLTTACFTATTSVCVTGLVVVDTYAAWSLAGQIIILLLIQLGGLGIIAAVSLLLMSFHKRFSMAERILINESFNLEGLGGAVLFLRRVIRGILGIELFGAFLYAFHFVPAYGPKRGLWYSLFHSISAFCNAGIDLLGSDSLQRYAGNPYVLGITMMLIILGGLGYVVWFDIFFTLREYLKRRFGLKKALSRLSEHTKLVLTLTFFLLLIGTLGIFAFESHNPETLGNLPLKDKVLGSLFQSVTFRTAGFAALPQEHLRAATCLFGCILMFIGGSPVGTAGGIKTVTFFLVACNALSYIRERDQVVTWKRAVPEEAMRKAAAIFFISALTTLFFTLLLLTTGPISLTDALYETTSALATVGLTRSLTPSLSLSGRWIIILAMYLGRIGPISMAIAFTKPRGEKNSVRYAEGKFYVG